MEDPLVDSYQLEMIWSAPEEYMNGWQLAPKSYGWLSGEDVTTKFLEDNSLKLIIRSSQVVQDVCSTISLFIFLLFLTSFVIFVIGMGETAQRQSVDYIFHSQLCI